MFAGFLLDGFITFQPSNAEDKALRMLLSSGASQAELQVADPQFVISGHLSYYVTVFYGNPQCFFLRTI